MTSADVIVRASLHNEVVSRMRQAIVEGVYPPGERLNERVLCERYSISRTPLREAFKVLALEGLVTISQNRGAVVTPLTLEEFASVIEVMSHLEVLVGRSAASRMSDEAIEEVRALHHEMCICHIKRDLSGYFRFNQQIHAMIVEGTGNPVIVSTYATLNRRVTRFRYMANLSDERWKAAIEEHEVFMRALIERDGEMLGALLRDHLLNKAAAIRLQWTERTRA
ncbi:MAG: GntR family transcriptional regulator [Rhizobiaceae bacterium]|nr:GntR family transcriptional regulator [Rhizobiaceae bacterium]